MERRRTFSREFKLEAVKLVVERGVSVAQAAKDLDVHENVLRKWVRELRQEPQNVFTIFWTLIIQGVKRQKYASDISREKFAEIEPELRSVRRTTKPISLDLYDVFCAVLYLLRTGCQWRFLPTDFPKWQSVYAYWSKWSQPDEHGTSVLERALKKSGWRGPRETGAQRLQHVLDRGRAKRQER